MTGDGIGAVPVAMTVAGSDSGGGAGIQADLKAFAAMGVFGTSAVTALTAQNTQGVQGVYPVPPSFVADQIDSVVTDLKPGAWKTGMLADAPIIAAVAERARHYQVRNLVVDPVMVAKGGAHLLQPEAREALIRELLPLARVVTPNLPEAESLTGFRAADLEGMKQSAAAIHAMGPSYVLVKGGHLEDSDRAVDVLFDGREYREFSAPRIHTGNTHGTGCTLAAAIAALLARGHGVAEAVERAKAYLTGAIGGGARMDLGGGHGPVDHFTGTPLTLAPDS